MFAATRWHIDAACDMVGQLTRHRRLTWEMAKREISDRYSGQVFGSLWAIGHPLTLMGVYIFMFVYVLKIKIGGTHEMPLDFTTYLLCGLIPWLSFQESMTKGVTSITSNSNLVKQVVFPLEVLPLKGAIAALVTQLVATLALAIYVLFTHGSLAWTFALVPLLWVLQFFAMAGVCYLLASLATYFRDMKDFLQLFVVIGMYLMPIFYLPDWVPSVLRPIIYLNPFSYMAWCYQDACYFGRFEHPWSWLVFFFGSVLVFHFGYQAFHRLKVGFGSVL